MLIPSDPLSFLKDDFQRTSSGVNPASLKESEFHVRAESFCLKDVPASDCSKRQQQLRAHHRAAVAVGIYKNRCCVLFLSGGVACQTTHGKSAPSLGNIGFSWVPRIVTGLPVCLTRRHPTACGRPLQAHMGCPRSLHSLPRRLGHCRQIQSWQWAVPVRIP